jgi:hypothetical protein
MILLLIILPFLILIVSLCLARTGLVVIACGITALIIMACTCAFLPRMAPQLGDGATDAPGFSLTGLLLVFGISFFAYLVGAAYFVQKRRRESSTKENPFQK